MSIAYVALGDSYAAGVGGGAARDVCWRSDVGYPVQVARRLGLPVAYNACLGATTSDVAAHQLAALGAETTHVSITVGGNDIGFVPVLIAAAEPAWMSNSDTAIDHALIRMRLELPGRLDRLFTEVAARAPGAAIVVSGYPALFAGVDCSPFTFFSAHEMRRLNAAADDLRSIIAAAAHRAGFRLARVASTFVGHAACSKEQWIHGVTWPLEGSFHPNALGHSAYADVFAAAFGAPSGPGEAVGEGGPVEVVAGPCVRGSAPTFGLPDLLSPRSLEGARSFGLDPGEVARLATILQASAQEGVAPATEAMAASARLHELDDRVSAARGGEGMS